MNRVAFWARVPFVRILFAVIPGVIAGRFELFNDQSWLLTTSLLIFSWVLAEFLLKRYAETARFAFPLFTFLSIFFLFALHSRNADIRNHPGCFIAKYAPGAFLQVRINEVPLPRARSLKSEVCITALINDSSVVPVKGKAILYFPKNSGILEGDVLLIRRKPDTVVHSNNPGHFNYAKWLSLRNIYHMGFVGIDEFVRVGNELSWSERIISTSRGHILSVLRKYVAGDGRVKGLAEALVIGYRNDLDRDLLQMYSDTGVVHIIAVSGLHLGLIYIVLNAFLQILFRKRCAGLQAIFVIVFLWFFSFLTGGSPSVLRAALMFSLMMAGKTWFRQASVYNSLAASAVLLLIYDPFLLWDAGFQLSYAAVTGIIWLQPLFYKAVFIRGVITRKIWEMSSVTMAAQVVTLPFCLYYFNQFPVIFLLTNLLVVPLSSIILFSGIAMIVFSWWGSALKFLGFITGELIEGMNFMVNVFAKFPLAAIRHIYIDLFIAFSIFFVIVGLVIFFHNRQKYGFYMALAGFLIISGRLATKSYKENHQAKLIVYKYPQQSIEVINGRQGIYSGDTSGISGQVELSERSMGVRRSALKTLKEFSFEDLHVVVADSNTLYSSHYTGAADILIISGNPYPAKGLLEKFSPSMVVLDGSNQLWKIAKWKSLCEKLLLRCHSVPAQGAFIYTLDQWKKKSVQH